MTSIKNLDLIYCSNQYSVHGASVCAEVQI